jgi:hypothetical protein
LAHDHTYGHDQAEDFLTHVKRRTGRGARAAGRRQSSFQAPVAGLARIGAPRRASATAWSRRTVPALRDRIRNSICTALIYIHKHQIRHRRGSPLSLLGIRIAPYAPQALEMQHRIRRPSRCRNRSTTR